MISVYNVSRHNRIIIVFCLTAFFIAGCENSVYLLKPDFTNAAFHPSDTLKPNCKIVTVIDERDSKPDEAGTAQVGPFEKDAIYKLSSPVTQFVKTAGSLIVGYNPNDSFFVPVTVLLRSFEVSEEQLRFSEAGNFTADMIFYYPVDTSSMVHVEAHSHKYQKGVEITDSLALLMYSGLRDCC